MGKKTSVEKLDCSRAGVRERGSPHHDAPAPPGEQCPAGERIIDSPLPSKQAQFGPDVVCNSVCCFPLPSASSAGVVLEARAATECQVFMTARIVSAPPQLVRRFGSWCPLRPFPPAPRAATDATRAEGRSARLGPPPLAFGARRAEQASSWG